LIGLNVVDTYQLAQHHAGFLDPLRNAGLGGAPVPVSKFAGVLSKQLLKLAERQSSHDFVRNVPNATNLEPLRN